MFSVLENLALKVFQKTRLLWKILVCEMPGSCVSSVDSCMRSFKVPFLNGAISLSCFASLCLLLVTSRCCCNFLSAQSCNSPCLLLALQYFDRIRLVFCYVV